MRVAVSGASGLIGSALVHALGERALVLVRDRTRSGLWWDPYAGRLDADALRGIGAFVHLSGENVASGRWTEARMQRLVRSRVETTAFVARTLASIRDGPRVLIVASAIGYYGDRGEEELDEASGPGQGILAELCARWEAAADPAREAGVRVVHARFGIVLARHGGALARMVPVFRAGLGGRIGSGRQWMSVVSLADAVGAIRHALAEPALDGPLNVVCPEPVRNGEFTRMLAGLLRRPALFAVPAFALRMALGAEAAQQMLLSSQRVLPRRLQHSGYAFQHPTALDALRAALDLGG
ncbi:MAG: TIGR01777 family oxidoreductase [Myxococcota bacterium]|nr:TIGR01777 family oxidoreductase [Myxococcota bacterium]MDW8363074.1 TIGR01777 family oxidoreductase [Myxococcales bacterium]